MLRLTAHTQSLTLVPGETYPIYVKNDFQITNAALSDELRSADGRSVLKVTHVPVNPAMYDDSDSELDSDDEDMMIGDDDLPEEDEFELDVEEGFKEVDKKTKGAKGAKSADVSMATEEDDEDDEELDDDEDDDFSDVEEEVTNVICALTAGKVSLELEQWL
jgi:FK506-binding nuclear protein